MSQSSHPAGTSPPRNNGKNRCNRKRLDRLPPSEPTDELLPRALGYYTRLCALPRRTRRALVRQWRRSLSAIALLLALGQAPALAATIAVAPGIPPDINADGICALIEAIGNANADAQAHTDCVTGNGADTIVLPTGSTQSLTSVDNSTHGPTGLPLIISTVTIQGRNSTIQRESSAPEFRILAVASSGDLTLDTTTVSGGINTYSNLYPTGGGVYNSGTLTLTNSTVSGNSGGLIGGGVFNSGTATLTHSTVSGNSAGFNRYGRAGGVYNSGTLTLTNSTVSGNSSPSCSSICQGGGGVDNTGTLTLTNSTVSGNSGVPGGVYNSGTATLTRALISGNFQNITPPSYGTEVISFGSIVANNYNLFGHDGDAGVVGFIPGPTDLVPSEGLGAILNTTLANNGGPTRTHALVTGSPAIDASPDDADCAATDQRGVSRPQGSDCDIGAFEASRESPCDTATPTRGCTVNGVPNRVCSGTSGKDRIVGTKRNDRIFGFDGADFLIGKKGDDLLCGGDGDDTVFGNAGSDRLFGNAGNDKLKGGPGPDTVNGGSGTDICKGGSGTDTGVSCETATSIP